MRMPLKGLAIGDGLCDPSHQLDYGDFLYQVGLLDEADRDLVHERTELAKLAMELQQWHQATDVSVVCISTKSHDVVIWRKIVRKFGS